MDKPIRLLRPTMDEQTWAELKECYDDGWWSFGPKVKEFEEAFAEKVGAKYAVATNSATSALDVCIKAYGLKGGELITPAFTFVSDAMVGEWNDMEVVFADIDPNTFCLDVDKLEVTKDTKVIIAVDCHGRLADVKAIKEKASNALVIEDAAHAMYTPGAGEHADITVWSFQAVKSMPIGDGGMITTNDEYIYNECRKLVWLGIEKNTYDRSVGGKYAWDYDITRGDGIKAYMTNPQSVIGLGQLRRLDEMNARRRQIAEKYDVAFDGQEWFTKPLYSHTVQYYTPRWKDRDGLMQFLGEQGIHTGVHFKPMSEFTYWKKAVKHPLPGTEVWKELLSLPVHHHLTDEEQEYVINKVKEFYEV